MTRAARDADVSRPTLHDLMRKHGLDAARFRRPELPAEDGPEAPTAHVLTLAGRADSVRDAGACATKRETPPGSIRTGFRRLRGASLSESRAAREVHRTGPPMRFSSL